MRRYLKRHTTDGFVDSRACFRRHHSKLVYIDLRFFKSDMDGWTRTVENHEGVREDRVTSEEKQDFPETKRSGPYECNFLANSEDVVIHLPKRLRLANLYLMRLVLTRRAAATTLKAKSDDF